MQRKKGISLIVLVITIIVMIILAAAIILSLNNAGIIGNANKAVEMTDEANVKQIAQLGWSDAYIEHREDVTKLREGVETALIDSGLNPDDYGMIVTTKGVEITKGWLQDKTTVVKGDITLAVGETIDYTATGTDYTKGWKILGAENGNLLIMSADNVSSLILGSNTDIEKSKTDYITGIQQLNDACIPYGKGEKATGVRSVKVEDINRVTGYNPETAGCGKDELWEYNNKITYYWDGSSEPYYESKNTISGHLGSTSNNMEHNGIFIYYNGKEFVQSNLSDEVNEGASITNKKLIMSLENKTYFYYPTTLTTESTGDIKGLNTGSKAYKLLFRNVDDTADDIYWLATSKVTPDIKVLAYGMKVVGTGFVGSNTFIASNGKIAEYTRNIRAVVSLSQDVVLTEGTTTDWTY